MSICGMVYPLVVEGSSVIVVVVVVRVATMPAMHGAQRLPDRRKSGANLTGKNRWYTLADCHFLRH